MTAGPHRGRSRAAPAGPPSAGRGRNGRPCRPRPAAPPTH